MHPAYTRQRTHGGTFWWRDWPIREPVMKTRARHTDKHTRRRTEAHTNETLPPRYLAGCILGAPPQSPSPSLSSWRMDRGNCQLKWNPICGVERGGHIECNTHKHTHTHTHIHMHANTKHSCGDQSELLPRDRGWSTCWASYGQYIKQTTLSLTTPLKTSTWLIIIN